MTQHPEEGTLHAYIDGELSPAEASALELHVGACALCAAALAEARGFAAAASRVITTLDAAPASAAKPASPLAGVAAVPSRRAARPPIFRVPYARAAALLLLIGGTAFVVDRTGTFERGRSQQAESALGDAAAGSDLAATAPSAAAPTTAPITAPGAVAAAADLSTGAGGAAPGNLRRERVAPRSVAGAAADGATPARPRERSAPPSETDATTSAQRGVAGDVGARNAVPVMEQTSAVAGKEAAPEAAKATALLAAPPPVAAADMRLEQLVVTGALSFAPTVERYRTKEGIVVTLTEEPLRTSFAEESVATRPSAPPQAQRRVAAPMAATQINSYRWSSPERGRIFTLSGPLTVAELEVLSKRLSELERLP
jgi:hypothetical protein